MTPGEPDAEQSAMTAMTSPRPGVQHDRDVPGRDLGGHTGGLGMGDQEVHDELTGVVGDSNTDHLGFTERGGASGRLTALSGLATTRTRSPVCRFIPGACDDVSATPTTDISSAGT